MQRPFILRDYQKDCVDEVQRRNVLPMLDHRSIKAEALDGAERALARAAESIPATSAVRVVREGEGRKK